MLYVDSILVPFIILIALVWKGLEKLGRYSGPHGDESDIDFLRRVARQNSEEARKQLEEIKKSKL